MSEPNHLLRAARERIPSKRLPNASLSRAELAEAVNGWLYEHTQRVGGRVKPEPPIRRLLRADPLAG